MENSIKVGYDSQTGFYTFKNTHTTLEVNGKPAVDPILGYKRDLVVTSEKPETITYKTSGRKLIGYDNTEFGITISVENYKLLQAKIDSTRSIDEDIEEYVYNTLEDEVFAIRFARTHKPVYESVEEVHNLEIELINYPVSAYSCIIPLYSTNADNVFETKCKYVPSNTELFFKVCTAFGIDKNRIDLPSHSGLRFVKIDDKFVAGMEEFEKTSNLTVIDTYEGCIARMDASRKKLEDAISFHLAKQSQKIVDTSTVGYLLTELRSLQNSISSLDVKQKEYNSQRALSNRIGKLINNYKEQA